MSTADSYIDARLAFERKTAQIANVGSKLQALGEAMRTTPGLIAFAGKSFPPEASASKDSITVPANKWADFDAIAQSLLDWHTLKAAAQSELDNLPAEKRGLIKP